MELWSCCTFLLGFALACGSSAGHSRRGAERRLSSPLLSSSPGGSPGEASRRQPWVPVQLLPLSEEARGSEWRLPVTLNYLPECDCACWEERSRLLRHCLCVQYIHVGFCSERVFVSRGLIFICCVSTRWRRSAEKLTREISACPFKETGLKRRLCL